MHTLKTLLNTYTQIGDKPGGSDVVVLVRCLTMLGSISAVTIIKLRDIYTFVMMQCISFNNVYCDTSASNCSTYYFEFLI